MLFKVRPWLRQLHNFWLSKPFGLDMSGLDLYVVLLKYERWVMK